MTLNRHWVTLEYPVILERLATYADFSAGIERALALEPAPDYREAKERLALTGEARALLLERSGFTLGGVSDIGPFAERAQHGVTLAPPDFLRIRDTILASANIHRLLTRLEVQFPGLADIAWRIPGLPALTDAIAGILDDRGEVRDSASPELARIRRELRVNQERIQERLRRMLTAPDVAPYLQEPIITRREGRFVIPVQASFKGQVRGIVHDRSGSGVTLFVEPLSVVDLNNALRELRLAEEEEVQRLLVLLTQQVAAVAEEILAIIEALADLDLVFAKARYAEDIDASEPELLPVPTELSPPQEKNYYPGVDMRLWGARHPLIDPEKVVPVDVILDDQTHVLVITGPNTGGKTVTLKTIGLLMLMARAGMHIPASPGSAFSCFEYVYADIGDEQSIEQSLSTFSSHLSNILSFAEKVDQHALVLLDELGAGTDPAEGAALAHTLLEAFRQKRCMAFVATHYPELKVYAHMTPGVQNASMEFDAETLSPTFNLTIGVPGRSNAFAIAKRLGMSDSLVEQAQSLLAGDSLRAEDMLDDLHALRIEAAQMRDAAHSAKQEAQSLKLELREQLEGIDEERRAVLREAKQKARSQTETVREEIATLRRRLRMLPGLPHTATSEVKDIEEATDTLEAQLTEPKPETLDDLAAFDQDEGQPPPRAGDTVRVSPLGMQGTLVEVAEGEAVVQAGALRTRVEMEALELVHRGHAPEPQPKIDLPSRGPSPGLQLDLRGLRAEEALSRLERYLSDAALADMPWVRIVHGKGTGALRREVRGFLKHHPVVTSYESALDTEGGSGATVVHLIHSNP